MTVLTLIFLAAAIGIIFPYKGLTRKQFAGISAATFVVMMIVVPTPDPDESTETYEVVREDDEEATTEAVSQAEPEKSEQVEYIERIDREIAALKKSPRINKGSIPTDATQMGIQLGLISVYAQLYADAPDGLTADQESRRQEYARLVKAYQRDAFPRLREAYGDIIDKLLWENDVDAAAIGARKRTLRMTAGMFAANANKKAAHDAAIDMLLSLRFEADRYEWYRGSGWEGWTFDPLPDDELATLSGSRWNSVESK